MSEGGVESLPLSASDDIVVVRRLVRDRLAELGFSLVDQTKMVTAASELARNAIEHGGGGSVRIEAIVEPGRAGLRLTFSDSGPGIPDVEAALRDGFSTGRGLGLGLGGARRLVSEFTLHSAPGRGTTVIATRWR